MTRIVLFFLASIKELVGKIPHFVTGVEAVEVERLILEQDLHG